MGTPHDSDVTDIDIGIHPDQLGYGNEDLISKYICNVHNALEKAYPEACVIVVRARTEGWTRVSPQERARDVENILEEVLVDTY